MEQVFGAVAVGEDASSVAWLASGIGELLASSMVDTSSPESSSTNGLRLPSVLDALLKFSAIVVIWMGQNMHIAEIQIQNNVSQ